MATDYQASSLWKAAFCGAGLNQTETTARDRLKVTLDRLEEHVGELLAKIPEDCRGLTVHDISHIHQLWHVASRICGSNYAINPLEGFVLGAAFLIHDAGLTASTYPGGVEGIKQTQLYRDMLDIELRRVNPDDEITDDLIARASAEQKDRVLFAFLRDVHSERALHLLDNEYVHPVTKHKWTLIPVELLFDVGVPIGKIAASHNWDISRVAREFEDPRSPPAAFASWAVDALKLACILRCADACAVDERRAPLMTFILENPRGVSRDHWKFQSYLKPGHLPLGQEGLVFESKRPMRREDMDAWWLAYEAITVADRELRDSDRLLKHRAGQRDHKKDIPLAAKRVEGAGDAALLAKYVTVDGWTPVDTAVRVSDPMAIVETFGGTRLYGDDHSAPIRELIQNAADAVRMRRLQKGYGPRATESPGQIQLSIKKLEDDTWMMRITDDGIGMPGDILTGPFIDFGKSLWRSDRLPSLYPGLASNPDFHPTGQFGIGFFASFIVGDNIKVMTKPYDGGDRSRRVLHFRNGVRARAEFRDYDAALDGAWPYGQSTVVDIIFATDQWLASFASLSFHGYWERPLFSTSSKFWDFFVLTAKRLVFCLDVAVKLECPHYDDLALNRTDIFEISNEMFAQEFNCVFAEFRNLQNPVRDDSLN